MESDKFTIGFLSSVTPLALPLNNSRDIHEEHQSTSRRGICSC